MSDDFGYDGPAPDWDSLIADSERALESYDRLAENGPDDDGEDPPFDMSDAEDAS